MISFVFGSCQRTASVHLSTAIGITQDSKLFMRTLVIRIFNRVFSDLSTLQLK